MHVNVILKNILWLYWNDVTSLKIIRYFPVLIAKTVYIYMYIYDFL